jgi:hypothetical protein
MGQRLAAFLQCDPASIVAVQRNDVPAPEPRPRDVSLDSTRWCSLFPQHRWLSYDEALKQMTPDLAM